MKCNMARWYCIMMSPGAAGKVKFFQFSTLSTEKLNLCE